MLLCYLFTSSSHNCYHFHLILCVLFSFLLPLLVIEIITEFRRWLVDCHKASYVPSCLSGGHKNLVTTELATTVATAEEMNTENVRRD